MLESWIQVWEKMKYVAAHHGMPKVAHLLPNFFVGCSMRAEHTQLDLVAFHHALHDW